MLWPKKKKKNLHFLFYKIHNLCGYSGQLMQHVRLVDTESEHKLRFRWWGLPRWQSGKESACQCRRCKRCGFNPWVRKIPGVGNGNPLQYSCLENSMNRGAWRAAVHGAAESQYDCAHTNAWSKPYRPLKQHGWVQRLSCLVKSDKDIIWYHFYVV